MTRFQITLILSHASRPAKAPAKFNLTGRNHYSIVWSCRKGWGHSWIISQMVDVISVQEVLDIIIYLYCVHSANAVPLLPDIKGLKKRFVPMWCNCGPSNQNESPPLLSWFLDAVANLLRMLCFEDAEIQVNGWSQFWLALDSFSVASKDASVEWAPFKISSYKYLWWADLISEVLLSQLAKVLQ